MDSSREGWIPDVLLVVGCCWETCFTIFDLLAV